MTGFKVPVDIANRALQHCGASRIKSASGLAENSKNASEINACYDQLRLAELRERYWTFAIKWTVLRAVDGNTMKLAAGLWAPATTYFEGSIVSDQAGDLWKSVIPNNLGNDPLLTTYWEPYFGPMAVALFNSTTTYSAGELVYTAPGDGTSRIYMSLQNSNADVPATATPWAATTTFFKNQVVTYLSVAYMSLVDLNLNQTPNVTPAAWTTSFVGGAGSDKWLQIGGAEFPMGVGVTKLNILYPIGAGPSTQNSSRNVFMLPAGYLRKASQNPKPGINPLGGPSGITYDDWLIENGFLTSSQTGPFPFRFVANFTDVSRMDAQFCEGLAARIALAIADTITQDKGQIQIIAKVYSQWEGEARTIDGIETGFTDAPDDDYLTVRL